MCLIFNFENFLIMPSNRRVVSLREATKKRVYEDFLKRRISHELEISLQSGLLENTRTAAKNERHSTTVVLHHLLEVEARRLFSPKYESLHAYAVNDLKYSAPSAQR